MWERNIGQLPFVHTPTGDQNHNPGMRPDQESNWQHFTLQYDTQPSGPHWSGLFPKA